MILGVIQARMHSLRLPGKVLADIGGEPMLERVYERVNKARLLDKVVIATTADTSDDVVAERFRGCFRGDEMDVLNRFMQVATAYQANTVVRITGDCPLIDSEIIDLCIEKFKECPDVEYVSNLLPRTYPRGLDVEVISSDILLHLWHNTRRLREHVTMDIRSNPQTYRIKNIANEQDYSYMRWTVDTQEDLNFAREVYQFFGEVPFWWKDVIRLLKTRPELIIKDMQEEPV